MMRILIMLNCASASPQPCPHQVPEICDNLPIDECDGDVADSTREDGDCSFNRTLPAMATATNSSELVNDDVCSRGPVDGDGDHRCLDHKLDNNQSQRCRVGINQGGDQSISSGGHSHLHRQWCGALTEVACPEQKCRLRSATPRSATLAISTAWVAEHRCQPRVEVFAIRGAVLGRSGGQLLTDSWSRHSGNSQAWDVTLG